MGACYPATFQGLTGVLPPRLITREGGKEPPELPPVSPIRWGASSIIAAKLDSGPPKVHGSTFCPSPPEAHHRPVYLPRHHHLLSSSQTSPPSSPSTPIARHQNFFYIFRQTSPSQPTHILALSPQDNRSNLRRGHVFQPSKKSIRSELCFLPRRTCHPTHVRAETKKQLVIAALRLTPKLLFLRP